MVFQDTAASSGSPYPYFPLCVLDLNWIFRDILPSFFEVRQRRETSLGREAQEQQGCLLLAVLFPLPSSLSPSSLFFCADVLTPSPSVPTCVCLARRCSWSSLCCFSCSFVWRLVSLFFPFPSLLLSSTNKKEVSFSHSTDMHREGPLAREDIPLDTSPRCGFFFPTLSHKLPSHASALGAALQALPDHPGRFSFSGLFHSSPFRHPAP